MTNYTMDTFENYLNNINGNNYGSKLRKNDSIQFAVLYKDWLRETQNS
jgi:hypothetical protein